ncbi:MAG: hypothetical protein B6243_01595 [Anaerolineaceae bacterium 4572_5.2]|nr:MAG: hypothetical protein B6243_01595 [Anaerolineaceae bacterium 4572_5.2]
MIIFENLTYTYPEGARPALQNVSLHIEEGDFALVVGMSGAGKSTLLRCINGLTPHFSGGSLAGKIRVNGLDPVQATPKVMSRHVGFVFQDPEAQFVMDRVEDEIAFALENAAMPPQEMRVRVEESLDLLDLAPLRNRPLETLSGGERQRTAIASALAFRPRVLVLDEPTSQLDPKSAEDVLHALTRLNSDLGLTILLAEHRLERVLPFVDTLIHLPYDDSPLLFGPPRQILSKIALTPPLVSLGKALQWQPLPLTIKEGKRFSRKLTADHRLPSAEPSRNSRAARDNDAQAYLRARNIEVAYNGQPALRGVDLTLYPGEIVALLGRNGAGKTTLLKSLIGLIRPARGKVEVAGRNIDGADVAEIAQQVGYLPQNPNALLFAETVRDELLITLRNHGFSPNRNGDGKAPPIEADALLEQLGLTDKAGRYPRDLSAGERQRVALGAITVTQPGALLLDEPTRGLDYLAKEQLVSLLRGWRDEGMAILLVTHDVELVAVAADRVILLSQGEIIASGAPAETLGASPLFAPQVARLFPGTGWLTVEDALANGRMGE